MTSVSRRRSKSGTERRSVSRVDKERRSSSRSESKREYTKCIGCLCNLCTQMRNKIMGNKTKEMSGNLCEGYTFNEEFLVNYTEKG